MSIATPTRIFDRTGKCISRSKNLRGILDHYHRRPDDLVVKVTQNANHIYNVNVKIYWPHSGDYALSYWADWRVLCDWLRARRSWSIARVTFDAPLYDAICSKNSTYGDPIQFTALRKAGIYVTRHAYAKSNIQLGQ